MKPMADNQDGPGALERAREQLEVWRNFSKPEIPLGEIEKLMIDVLGVTPITGRSGSQRSYQHEALEGTGHHGPAGIFSVHVTHKRRPGVRKHDFRRFLYPALTRIIEYLERRK